MGGRKRAASKKSTAPKLKLDPAKRVECQVSGEELESVLASLGQMALAVLPVGMAVRLGDNRNEVAKYVTAYIAAVRLYLVELLGEEMAERGISSDDPRWPEFVEMAAYERAEIHKIQLYPVGLGTLIAEDVRMSGAAVGLLLTIGVVVDDR